jgi:nuclear RNA export factor
MADDPLLKKHNIASLDSPQAPKAMGPVILKLASKLEPRIVTLSIANNSFTSLSGLSTLNHYLPQLANLSLEKNQIKSYRDLDRLLPTSKTGAKPDVSALKELILKGNPLRKIEEEKGQLIHYKRYVGSRYSQIVS